MLIYNKSSALILKKGIYVIKNIITNKVYVGSAARNFIVRYNTHYNLLKKNQHFNKHLQDSWNKYKEENFQFRVLFICENNLYHWEKRAIDLTKALDNQFGYNMNSNINNPPIPSDEARKRQGVTIKKRNLISREYLNKYNSGEISFEDIPIEYNGMTRTAISARNYMTGKKYDNTSHFKVKHTITKAYLEGRKKYSEQKRTELPNIKVISFSGKNLGIFRSSKDIEEISQTSPNIFSEYIKGRFSKPRKGKNVDYLSAFWINKSIKDSTLYKGFAFIKIIMPSEEEISQIITPELSKDAEMPT